MPQLAARLNMKPDRELLDLCAALDLSALPPERVGPEFHKLLQAPRPSIGLSILAITHVLRWFPELDTLRNTPQDPVWHPEGDVWTHTCLTVDKAARLRSPSGTPTDNRILVLSALCHELGKPETTIISPDARIRSPNHANAGVGPTRRFLARLSVPRPMIRAVSALVLHHLAPATYVARNARPPAYRRLARKLHDAGTSPALLARLALADHLGRTTYNALAGSFREADTFLDRMQTHAPDTATLHPAVLGRHLVARGMKPGPPFGPILKRSREIQEETGCSDPNALLDQAIAQTRHHAQPTG